MTRSPTTMVSPAGKALLFKNIFMRSIKVKKHKRSRVSHFTFVKFFSRVKAVQSRLLSGFEALSSKNLVVILFGWSRKVKEDVWCESRFPKLLRRFPNITRSRFYQQLEKVSAMFPLKWYTLAVKVCFGEKLFPLMDQKFFHITRKESLLCNHSLLRILKTFTQDRLSGQKISVERIRFIAWNLFVIKFFWSLSLLFQSLILHSERWMWEELVCRRLKDT